MRTLSREPMSPLEATTPVGSALRIAPSFIATTTDEVSGIETEAEAHYDAAEGRYLVAKVTNRAVRAGIDVNNLALRQVPIQAIVQAAAPQCIALQ